MRFRLNVAWIAWFVCILSFKICECPSSLHLRVFIAASPGVVRRDFSLARVFLGSENVSSVRFVEIRWYNLHPNVSLALYDREPKSSTISNWLIRIEPLDHSSGFYLTDYRVPPVDLSVTKRLSGECMFYWIAVLDERSQVTSYDCFRGFPFWMHQSRRYLEKAQVRRAFIPGTHNSGTYNYYVPHRSHSRVTQFVECQDESIFNQLFFGARYFELRASFAPQRRRQRCVENNCDVSGRSCDDGEFWSYHGSFVCLGSIRQIAIDIREFLDRTQEIVLIDFHKFKVKGKWFWTPDLHLELWKLLVAHLGEYMVPVKADITFGEMWRTNKRLIVSTNYPIHDLTPCLWPPPVHLWPNAENFAQLELFFDQRLCSTVNDHSSITVTKAQLTPRPNFRLLRNMVRNRGGVRYFTPEMNRRIDRMFQGKWAGANVVAVDYLLSSDVVRIAIIVNQMRAQNRNASVLSGGGRSPNFACPPTMYWRARDEF